MVFVVEDYVILNMCDTVLNGYTVFASKEDALESYPDAIVAADYPSDLKLDQAKEKQLNCMYGCAHVLVEH